MKPRESEKIEISRRLAKKLTKENGKTYMQNLHEIAKQYGYKSWDALIKKENV